MLIGLLASFSPPLFYRKTSLPARLTGLTCLAAIIVASTASSTAATKSLSPTTASAARPVGFWFGFVDGQRTAAQFSAVQGRNGFLSLRSIGHLDKREAARASGF